MALRDDLAAIENNGALSEDQKRVSRYQTKIAAILAQCAGQVGGSWTLDGVTYRLNGIKSVMMNGTQVLLVDLRRTQTGFRFDPYDRLAIVNPFVDQNGKFVDEMSNAEKVNYLRVLVAGLPPGTSV